MPMIHYVTNGFGAEFLGFLVDLFQDQEQEVTVVGRVVLFGKLCRTIRILE